MADESGKEVTAAVEEPESDHGDAEPSNDSAEKEEQEEGPDDNQAVISTPGEADIGRAPSADFKVEEPDSEEEEPLPDQVMETGRVTFLYTPRVEVKEVKSMQDVQRFYLILEPQRQQHLAEEQTEGDKAGAAAAANGASKGGSSTGSSGKVRLVVVPKKRLPDTKRHERFFAFVDAVSDSVTDITAGMTASEHETKTRGTRHQGAARVVGEGSYVIAKGGSRGATHLGYKLEVPSTPGEAQETFRIKKAGSYVISIKKPGHRPEGAPSAGPEPEYSEPERKRFKGRAWIDVETPSLLDKAGSELLLVGAKDDPVAELGDAGGVLEEIYHSDSEAAAGSKDAVGEKLKKHVEPEGTAAVGKGGDKGEEPIPVAPAVEGKLV